VIGLTNDRAAPRPIRDAWRHSKLKVEDDNVNIRSLIMPVLLGLAIASPTRSTFAQRGGTVELGGFLQLEHLDDAFQTKSIGGGAGGRFGIFFTPRWELEGDASYTQVEPLANRGGNPKVQTGGDKIQINYYVGRLNYNIPWGGRPGNAIILGLGAGADRVDSHTDLVIAPQIGLRAMLGQVVGLRFDVASMTSPNPASGTFKYPTTINAENKGAAYLSNFQARAGISLMFGNSRPYVPPPVVAQPEPAPAPVPAPAPAPTVNQDSIDRANRLRDSLAAAERALAEARALLNAPIYFDFDKSEIRSDAKSALDAKLPLLKANPSMKIRIEGNTDSRGSNEYNMALGLRRANAARRYLASQGIEAARFDVVSYGEERPVDQGTTEDAYQKNRRDDFVITVGSDNITVPR
jgi:peptidoglycan-associated lipoprotein